MVKAKKITKRKLKEPDELVTLTQRALLFAEAHAKRIVAAGVIALAVVLGVVFYQMWDSKKEAEAGRQLSQAMEMYQRVSSPYREASAAEVKVALGGFDELIKQFSGTASGKFALLHKGNLHLKLGELDEAIKAYQAFLDKAGNERLYRLFGLEGLGYAYEGKKEYAKAVDAYQQIIAMGETFQSGDAYLSIGRCYERLGKNQEALESYRAFLKTVKKSEMTNAVLRKVSLLEK
jgi:tetratricopeptide (TPR) repeat protein